MQRPLVLALGAALLLGGCESANPADSANPSEKARPSPLPYGYKEPKGQTERPVPKADGQGSTRSSPWSGARS